MQYIGLDGTVGIIANGAGLAMSTLDTVKQVGGSAANFLDIGGGANAEVVTNALTVINTDHNVKAILINIFGGITRGDEVARGIVEALQQRRSARAAGDPHRRDELDRRTRHPQAIRIRPRDQRDDHARSGAKSRRTGRRELTMAIFADENSKVVVQGLTGSQGRFYGLRNRDYGTKVVAGTNPRKAGTDVEGIPVYATVAEAVRESGREYRVHHRARRRSPPLPSSKQPRAACPSSSA